MKPVLQTRFGKGEGNCLAAAVASILELPLGEVPDLNEPNKNQIWVLCDWLAKRGLWFVEVELGRPGWNSKFPFPGHHLIIGPSPRHDGIDHAVVGFKGHMVHDPHPSGAGLVRPEWWGLLCVLNPAGDHTCPECPIDPVPESAYD